MKSTTVMACVDCKHYVRTLSMRLWSVTPRCSARYTPEIDLVTGRAEVRNDRYLPRCSEQRAERNYYNEPINFCGEQGLLWTPRKQSPAATMLLLKRAEK